MLIEKDFILDSCKVTPGFEFYPKRRKKIDISKLHDLLCKNKYYISKNNEPFYVHIKTKIAEVTIFSSLKIIVKDILEEDVAKKILNELLEFINQVID